MIDSMTFEKADTNDQVKFDVLANSTEEILIHKYRQDDAYLSAFQNPVDGTITIAGSVRDQLGNPVPNRPVSLRVIDPPDRASYVPAAERHADDNLDPQDHPSGGGSNLNIRLNSTSVASDANGRFSVSLTPTTQYGGDNYIVEGSIDAAFPCAASATDTCSKTGILESWKRMYIEMDQMYRASRILTANAAQGASTVFINDKNGYHNGDNVVLIHASSFTRTAPSDGLGFYSESHRIVSIANNHTSTPGNYIVTLDGPLTHDYFTDFAAQGLQLGDALANITHFGSGADPFFRFDDRYVKGAYADAFVDAMRISTSGTGVPFYDALNPTQMSLVAGKWFAAKTTNNIPSNHGIAIAASTRASVAPGTISLGTTVGVYSYVWRDTIDTVTSGPVSKYPLTHGHDPVKMSGEVLVHELAHQWSVNPSYPNGECTQNMYANAKYCQMNSPNNTGQFDDDIVQFHYVGTAPSTADSEYMTMRLQQEPKKTQ